MAAGDDAGDHLERAPRVAVGLVVEVDDARPPLDQLELGLEARPLADVDQGLGHDEHAALGAVQVALEVLVGRPRGDVHHGVHLVGDVDGVREGAVGLHRGERVGLDIDLHDDVLQAVGGQHAEAQVHGVGDPDALVQADVRLDAVVELLDVDVEPGDQVRAHDLVAVHFQVGDVVAGEVRRRSRPATRAARVPWRRRSYRHHLLFGTPARSRGRRGCSCWRSSR